VEIRLNIPDDLAHQVASQGEDPARMVLEALAIEGYRSKRLSESSVRRMLGFESRIQVHAFLKQHDVYLHYSLADLERDRATSDKFLANLRAQTYSGRPRQE
jgi:hypothetical protein